jgi:hypothetical protein
MKVVFMDIDGVLNSNYWNASHQIEISNGEYIDEKKVQLFARIIEKTGAVIVMHSGWRLWFDDKLKPTRKEASNLVEMLRKYSLDIFDKTPDFTTEEIRKAKKFSLVKSNEILAWLGSHSEVTNYIVIDDLNLHNDELRKYQIRTDSALGLTELDVENSIHILNENK